MPELAVVTTLEYELAVVLELLSLFVSRRAVAAPHLMTIWCEEEGGAHLCR